MKKKIGHVIKQLRKRILFSIDCVQLKHFICIIHVRNNIEKAQWMTV